MRDDPSQRTPSQRFCQIDPLAFRHAVDASLIQADNTWSIALRRDETYYPATPA